MKYPNSLCRGLLAGALLGLLAATAPASLITWGAAQNITGDSDVITTGTLLKAFGLGPGVGAPTVTLNSVPFTIVVIPSNTTAPTTFGAGDIFQYSTPGGAVRNRFLGLSPEYNRLLQNSVSALDATLTLNGLTSGLNYAFEWWSDLGTVGNATTAGGPALAPGVGQFQIGTFTATGTSQVINFNPAPGSSGIVVNAFQLRQVAAPPAVPEPGTALAGLMLLGLCGARRRRA